MKRFLAPMLVFSLLNGTAIIAQPAQPDNRGQSNKPDKEKKATKKPPEQRVNQPAPAASQKQAVQNPANQQREVQQRETQQRADQQRADQQRVTQQRTEQQRADQQRATQQRETQQRADQRRATQQRDTQQGADQQRADQQRATQQRATQQRETQQRADQQRADQQRAMQQRETQQREPAQQRWSRGDRLPDQYRQNTYTVNNWQRFGLKPPPSGQRWHRNDNNDFFLVAISSGLIADSLFFNDRERNWDQRYSRTYGYDDDVYYRECRTGPDPAGILVGALIGGLIGNSAGQGNRTNATIAGIIIGGSAGAALTSQMDCGDRSYAYRIYSRGFNDGRINYNYDWRNPANGHRGTFRVSRYYYDAGGFRCADFRQTLYYLQANHRYRNGRACLQPNGAWVIVN